MRPKTIVYFEWIIFRTILLNVLEVYLSWGAAQAAAAYPNSTLAIIILIFIFVLIGTLTLLVSRRRKRSRCGS